jgi:hypothetical protein
LKLKFYNKYTGLTQKIIINLNDYDWKSDYMLAALLSWTIVFGITFLIVGWRRKKRLIKVEKQAMGLLLLKYEPLNIAAKEFVNSLK